MAAEDRFVQELRDRAAIHDLLMRYARGVDRRDLESVAACFAPDARYEGALGIGSIEVALSALRERMQRYQTTMHFLANQLIELNSDRARCETYALVYHRLAEESDQEDFVVGVRYVDELARHGDGWWIVHRTAVLEWQRYDAVVLPPG
jgi:3-phenylpropionate/cinnamic acid dioxygenase small subunit